MAAAGEDPLQELFTKLDGHLGSNERKKALRILDSILKRTPSDMDAIRCKVALLLEANSYQEALQFLNSCSGAGAQHLVFERAYAQYRLGSLEQALQTLQGAAPEQAVPRLQLEAQLQYRLGRFDRSVAAYQALMEQHQVPAQELRVNLLAALLGSGDVAGAQQLLSSPQPAAGDSFELAFNRACVLLEQGDLTGAQELLSLAERVGRETLFEEELSEADVEAELAPLAAQFAHLSSRAGRVQQAIEGYQELLEKGPDDQVVEAVSRSNLLALQFKAGATGQRKWLGDALRRLEAFYDKEAAAAGNPLQLAPVLQARLSQEQQEVLHCNHALLLLHGGRAQQARELAEPLKIRYPRSALVGQLGASLLVKAGNRQEADQTLQQLEPPTQAAQQQVVLMRAQLAASGDRPGEAAELLASLSGLQREPAAVATQVDLLEKAGDLDAAARAAEQALAAVQSGKGISSEARAAAQRWLLQQLVHIRLKGQDRAGATQAYQQLQALDQPSATSAKMLAQLARAGADADPEAALGMQAGLPPLRRAALDGDALEASGTGRRTHAHKRAAEGGEGDVRMADSGASAAQQARKKRKRRVRLPKGFDPENPGPPPDPERWLPKWQRSGFVKRKRNREQRREKGAAHLPSKPGPYNKQAQPLRLKPAAAMGQSVAGCQPGALLMQEVVRGSQGAGRVDEALDQSTVDSAMPADARPKPPARPAGAKGRKGKGRR